MDNKKRDISTENRIIEAARQVFTKKGYAATRTDDIAKEAGINRALLHYYFRSKDKMFEIIFTDRLKEFFSGIVSILLSEKTVVEKIRALVMHDITTLQEHPDMPLFVISEITNNKDRFIEFVNQAGIPKGKLIEMLQNQIDREIEEGKLKPTTSAQQLMMNTMSMAIYPFLARPIIQTMMMMDDRKFNSMIEKRKKEVADFIINSIKA